MKPKKKSNIDYIIAGMALLVAIFISLNVGMALTDKGAIETAQGEASFNFNTFFDCFNDRIANNPFDYSWNENVKKSLLWGCFVWFIAIAYWFTSKKKYIVGKEYGTAEWGKQKDISDLFAVNLMNKELKQAKQVKSKLGCYFAKKKVIRNCKMNSDEIKAVEMGRLEQWKADHIPRDKKLNKEQKIVKKEVIEVYEKQKIKIEETAKQRTEDAIIEAWMPYKLKRQYEIELAEIADQYQKLKTGVTMQHFCHLTTMKQYRKMRILSLCV